MKVSIVKVFYCLASCGNVRGLCVSGSILFVPRPSRSTCRGRPSPQVHQPLQLFGADEKTRKLRGDEQKKRMTDNCRTPRHFSSSAWKGEGGRSRRGNVVEMVAPRESARDVDRTATSGLGLDSERRNFFFQTFDRFARHSQLELHLCSILPLPYEDTQYPCTTVS